MRDIHQSQELTASDELSHNVAWVTYVAPFRLIVHDDDQRPWKVTLEELNANSYDYGRLSSVVSRLPILGADGLSMLVCYDGGLALPRAGTLINREQALAVFNATLCNLLIGGMFCEAVVAQDLVWGCLHQKRAIWPVLPGESTTSRLHFGLRVLGSGSYERIAIHEPKVVKVSELLSAFQRGSAVVGNIPNLSPEFLITAVTEFERRNWSSALVHFWVVIEQLTEHLWKHEFIAKASNHPLTPISRRVESFKDHRTWSIAVRHELLFQKGIISEATLQKLFPARKSRNDLLHSGIRPIEETADASYEATLGLLQSCSGLQLGKFSDRGFRTRDFADSGSSLESCNFDEWRDIS